MKNAPICQSCAMPMDKPELFGTNADGSRNTEYCCYCMKDGKFNWDCTMEDMLEDCIKVEIEHKPDCSPEEIRKELTAVFPTLKRWKKEWPDMLHIDCPAYCVIGREGGTKDGEGFIQKLWEEANAHFDEIAPLAAQPLTLWGAMSAYDRSLKPWEEEFTCGLYLAGIAVQEGAQPPEGWSKWDFPGYKAIALPMTETAFAEGLAYLQENKLQLVLAVQERTDPNTGETLLVFPIKLL